MNIDAVHIYIINVSGSVTDEAGEFLCLPESPCYNIVLDNVDFTGYKTSYQCENAHGKIEGDDSPKPCLNTTTR